MEGVFGRSVFPLVLLFAIVKQGVDKAAWSFGHAGDGEGPVFELLHHSHFQYFPEFEVGPAEDGGLLHRVVVHHVVGPLIVLYDALAVLNGGSVEALVLPIYLYELTDVQVLLYVGSPQSLNRRNHVLQLP